MVGGCYTAAQTAENEVTAWQLTCRTDGTDGGVRALSRYGCASMLTASSAATGSSTGVSAGAVTAVSVGSVTGAAPSSTTVSRGEFTASSIGVRLDSKTGASSLGGATPVSIGAMTSPPGVSGGWGTQS